MRVVMLTRTDRPSGAAVAAEILRSSHTLCAVIAEKRTSMLIRKEGLPAVILKTLRDKGFLFLAGKLFEFLWIKIQYVSRLCKMKHPGQPYHSIGELMLDHDVPYHEVCDHNGPECLRILRSIQPDVIVLTNTRIIGPDVIGIPSKGCINLHLGKLPEYRGAASAFWELYNGETKGGVTVHFIDEKLDSGDILIEESVDILRDDTEERLYRRKLQRGAVLMRNALDLIATGEFTRTPQDPSRARMYRFPDARQRAELARKLRRVSH